MFYQPRVVSDLDEKTVPFRRVMKNPAGVLRDWRTFVAISEVRPYWLAMNARLELSEDDRNSLQTFIDACSELAQLDVLWSPHSVLWQFTAEKSYSTSIKVVTENDLRNIAVAFRRVYSDSEPGPTCFASARNIIQRNLSAQLPNDLQLLLRENFSAPIENHIGRLLNKNIETLTFQRIYGNPHELADSMGYMEMLPNELISLFFYGGLIHSGKKRAKWEKLRANPKDFHIAKYFFIGVVRSLAIAYFSYAELILILCRGNKLNRPVERDMHVSDYVF